MVMMGDLQPIGLHARNLSSSVEDLRTARHLVVDTNNEQV